MADADVTPPFDNRICPRCSSRRLFPPGPGLSRTTRDGEGALIGVCSHCSELEAMTDEAGMLAPFTDWPLSPERLAQEERAWYARRQAAIAEKGA